ncbi:hypothetical protein [Jiangella asiatica]|uniref:Uncharacterized protein n=1 Tax=Jiangella asiatica TaxID=2530372 RepID=A0A4R5CT91_9ACTN|nr:hypothetical protein [Jiangella asiatica]TDE02817.1 hypothetical protein E1269_21235 [Jiangella asiatica]
MATKVVVPYEHRSEDLQTIYLAIASGSRPTPDSWKPALRDTIAGKRVVWARFPAAGRRVSVWLRDRDGERAVTSTTV